MKILTSILLVGLISAGSMGNAMADTDPMAAENFSATMTFTTDYAYRGTSFSDKGPAIQGSFDYGYGSFFAGAWASSTSPTDDNGVGGTLEIDYYVGWADAILGFDLMIMPLVYTYPDQQGGGARDDTTFELWTSVGHGLEGFGFLASPYIKLEFNYSPRFFDHVTSKNDSAWYIRPSIAFTLPRGFGLDVGYGYQYVGGRDGNDFFADNYEHIDAGLSNSLLGFDLDLRYHHNFDKSTIGRVLPVFDSDLVFSISRTF